MIFSRFLFVMLMVDWIEFSDSLLMKFAISRSSSFIWVSDWFVSDSLSTLEALLSLDSSSTQLSFLLWLVIIVFLDGLSAFLYGFLHFLLALRPKSLSLLSSNSSSEVLATRKLSFSFFFFVAVLGLLFVCFELLGFDSESLSLKRFNFFDL